jgi:hypothetical protein
MITATRTTTLALLASLTLIAAPSAEASQPQGVYVQPGPQFDNLPHFGFHSYTIFGVGERITFVNWNGLARQLGLERGDTILALNNFPLTYHGAWRDALREAMYQGGWAQLAIWDVRTGDVVYRQAFVGSPGYGPITPKSGIVSYGPPTSHYLSGPITSKSMNGSPKKSPLKFKIDLSKQLEKLANLPKE